MAGNVKLVSGTTTVNNTNITAASIILVTPQDINVGGTLTISSRVPGTSFTITNNGTYTLFAQPAREQLVCLIL